VPVADYVPRIIHTSTVQTVYCGK